VGDALAVLDAARGFGGADGRMMRRRTFSATSADSGDRALKNSGGQA
jgi:hypothetical protein